MTDAEVSDWLEHHMLAVSGMLSVVHAFCAITDPALPLLVDNTYTLCPAL